MYISNWCVRLIFILALCCCIFGCQVPSKAENQPVIEDYQVDLLEIAFKSASVLPSNPFIKEKSRNQEQVVMACIELGLLKRASEYTGQIENWRRSKCYAEIALYYSKMGKSELAQNYIESAKELYDKDQEWRNDEIRIAIAKAYAFLNEFDIAYDYINDLDKESHIVKVNSIEALSGDAVVFDKAISSIDKYISSQEFYPLIHSKEALVNMYEHFYESQRERIILEDKITGLMKYLPYIYSFNSLVELCNIFLQQNDIETAVKYINQISDIVYTPDFQWRLEDKISLSAKLAALRFRAGSKEKAIAELKVSYNLFMAEGEKIGAMFRGRPLRILAESYYTANDLETSLMIYKLALKHAVINPNKRPQAADLTSICCSLASNGIKPDEQLMDTIKKIYKDLTK